jgi:hypothetical protein
MKAIVDYFFRWVASLALLVLNSAQAVSAQTLAGLLSYQATGIWTVIKAQPNSALVRVRYENNNPGPVYLELLNDKRCRHQALRRREVFVVNSERYSDPRAELLRGQAWEAARGSVARALERSLYPAIELGQLQAQFNGRLRGGRRKPGPQHGPASASI